MAKPIRPSILSTVRARLAKSLCKIVEITRAEIGDGPVADAAIGPVDDIVAGDRLPLRRIGSRGRNGNKADQMLAMAIDERRHRDAIDYVDASADQGKSFAGEIDDARRLRNAPAEPWLDGVAVGRADVGRLRRHQGAQVTGDNHFGGRVGWLRAQRQPG